jgi:hypothetical protein
MAQSVVFFAIDQNLASREGPCYTCPYPARHDGGHARASPARLPCRPWASRPAHGDGTSMGPVNGQARQEPDSAFTGRERGGERGYFPNFHAPPRILVALASPIHETLAALPLPSHTPPPGASTGRLLHRRRLLLASRPGVDGCR